MKSSTEQQVITPLAGPTAQSPDVARLAGRGTAYITAAKIWFMVSGLGIEVALTRLMSVEEFGIYRVVIGVVSIVNAVIITATYQTVSKHVSEAEEKAGSVKRKALRLQALIGGSVSLGFFLLAPVVANYLNDVRLVNYLRLASLITLSYSFYAVFTGYFNGLKRFLSQALLDVTYSTLKLAFIVLLVGLGYGVIGGVGGFALAAFSILMISAVAADRVSTASGSEWVAPGISTASGSEWVAPVVEKIAKQGDVRAKDLLQFQGYLLAFSAAINLLQKIDLILIKSLSSADATTASENAGYYGAAINLANITYQIVISITFVVFPLISQATFANDRRAAQTYISNTLRYSLMMMALVATLFSANAGEVLRVVFPDQFQAAAPALTVVAYGILFFGLLYVLTTIISAGGRPRGSLIIGMLTLAISAALNALLIPRYGLVGAATGTSIAMLIGTTAGGAFVATEFRVLVSALSVVRITLCAALVYTASILLPLLSRPLIVGKLAVLSLLFVGLLVVTREIGREDLGLVRRILGKGN